MLKHATNISNSGIRFYRQPSTLPKEALVKFHLSAILVLRFMVTSVAPTLSSTFYACLITLSRQQKPHLKRTMRLWASRKF